LDEGVALGKRAFANRFFQESVDEGAEFEVEYLPTFFLWGRKAGGRKTLARKKAILPDSGVKGQGWWTQGLLLYSGRQPL
jgi:hypothetical protein